MLNFIDGNEIKVGKLVTVIYGAPNVGKTSLALTANKPAVFDFDGGAYRAGNRSGKQIMQVSAWSDMSSMTAADVKDCETIVIDTVGTCLDALSAEIVRENPKAAAAGNLSLHGYGILKTRFKAFLHTIKAFDKDIVLVAHASEEKRGDETVDRIVAIGASKQEIYQMADLMGRMSIVGKERILSFDPTAVSFGKNVGLDDYIVQAPSQNPTMLADILVNARDLINCQSQEQKDEHDRLNALRLVFAQRINSADDCNEIIPELKDSPKSDKRLLMEMAKSAGYEFDKERREFIEPVSVAVSTVTVEEVSELIQQ